jgi:hypothetical protein
MGTNGGTAQVNGNAMRDDEQMSSPKHSDSEYSDLIELSEALVRHRPKGQSSLRLLKGPQPAQHGMDFIIISEENALSKGRVVVSDSGVVLKSLSRITDVSSLPRYNQDGCSSSSRLEPLPKSLIHFFKRLAGLEKSPLSTYVRRPFRARGS